MSLRTRVFPEPWMRWYDLSGLRRVGLTWWVVTRKNWHPQRRRLARARAVYWFLIRGHDTEICCLHGGPVGVVFHVPDVLWRHHSGFPDAATGGGVLCIDCFSVLYKESGEGFLRWTCATNDSVMSG